MLGTSELNTILQVGSHKSGAEGVNHLFLPANYTSSEAAQDKVGILGSFPFFAREGTAFQIQKISWVFH